MSRSRGCCSPAAAARSRMRTSRTAAPAEGAHLSTAPRVLELYFSEGAQLTALWIQKAGAARAEARAAAGQSADPDQRRPAAARRRVNTLSAGACSAATATSLRASCALRSTDDRCAVARRACGGVPPRAAGHRCLHLPRPVPYRVWPPPRRLARTARGAARMARSLVCIVQLLLEPAYLAGEAAGCPGSFPPASRAAFADGPGGRPAHRGDGLRDPRAAARPPPARARASPGCAWCSSPS